MWRRGEAPEAAEGDQAELGQAVGHLLLVGVLARLHAALLQGVVVVEEVHQQVPEHAGVVQVGLQEEIHREGADALHAQSCSLWETLRKGDRGDREESEDACFDLVEETQSCSDRK